MRPRARIGVSRARPSRVIPMRRGPGTHDGNAPAASHVALATSPAPTRRWGDLACATVWCLLLVTVGALIGLACVVAHATSEPGEEQW